MKLGAYPSKRYSRSWITQRLLNRLPEYSYARISPSAIAQQLLNPAGQELQRTLQSLTDERYNLFLPSANINMMDIVYYADLPSGMAFSKNEDSNNSDIYVPPTVYSTIEGTEYELSIAEKNNIETFWQQALPSRVEYGESSVSYEVVVPETTVANFGSVSIGEITAEGILFITLKGNSNWEVKSGNKIYYPKIHITGTTRKGLRLKEVVPFRYNGTFKTINEWKEIDDIFVSYLSDDASITVESFPFGAESLLDTRNIFVPNDITGERIQFSKLSSQSWGAAFAVDTFSVSNMNVVRLGVDEKETQYQVELLDTSETNIEATGWIVQPETDYIYVVDNTNLYVYDSKLPYPDIDGMELQSEDAKIDIYSDKWLFYRDEEATVKTRNNDVANVPRKYRWKITIPDGTTYYLGDSGSLDPIVTDEWHNNPLYEQNLWTEQTISVDLADPGTYQIALECEHFNRNTKEYYTLITKLLWFVPSIVPEIQYELPVAVQNNEGIGRDSDGQVWILKYGNIYKLNIFYDYFMVDYDGNRIWVREEYNSVRIVP